MWNYVVTAQKPTAVTHSVVGRFTGPNDLNLIISKSTRIEIHLLAPEGLTAMLDVPVYGRISVMELIRFPNESQDFLFISTERYKFCILAYDLKTGDIITKANGDLREVNGRPADIGQLCTIDPDLRCIALHLYDGSLKVIPIDSKGQLRDAFNLRIEELQVIDIKFMYGCKVPTFAVLYQDNKESRHLKTYEIEFKDKDIKEAGGALANVERGAGSLIALSQGGVLIVGEQSITYHDGGNTCKTVRVKTSIIKAVGKLDQNKYLFGDFAGNLHVVVLVTESNKVVDIKTELLGEISIPSTVSYLDNNFVFIGSTYGDSQLIRLSTEKNENGSYIELVDKYDNLGPIVDFCVVDLDRQGQGQVVTCSGAFKDGSIRIIRNGIGINETATVDFPGIKGIWTLKHPSDPEHDKYIVFSFVTETRVLSMSEELEEITINGFVANEPTVYCGNVTQDQFVQVTPSGVQLVNADTLELIAKWTCNSRINVASGNNNQLLLATGGGNLVYLQIEGNEIKQLSSRTLEFEISCVNINPLGNDTKSHICAVGMWTDISVRIFRLPDLEPLVTEKLGGEIIPRSVLLTTFEGIHYLLCGLGDGHLFTFVLQDLKFTERKKLSLGTQPIILNTFKTNGQHHIFAASDRPTVIYSNNKKLLYSNVNLKEVNYVAPLHSESFPYSLAITKEDTLTIGTIDEIQKLHIRTVPLREMPRRIAHQASTSTFGVLTVTTGVDDSETGWFHILDAQTFEKKDSFKLSHYESPCSIVSTSLGDDADTVCFIVGTAFALPNESEPTKGRLLLFQVVDGTIKLVSETEVSGCVYSLAAFQGRVIAGINSRVQLFKLNEGQLTLECSHQGHILALCVVSRGDFIIVGDLMRSISLLLYKVTEGTPSIEEIARDFNPNWMTAVESFDLDSFIGAENSYNLFTLKRNSEATTDDERSRLEISGMYHLGEFVNKFKHGSLVMKLSDNELNFPSILYGGVHGSIGVIASIPQDLYVFLNKVQQNVSKVIRGVGGFSHEQWRSFENDRKIAEAKGFIDGDLVESLLDLPSDKMKEVVKGLNVTVEELVKKIESIQQALH